MSGPEEPWGIIVTGTLHLRDDLHFGGERGPLCGNEVVWRKLREFRAQGRRAHGSADGRPTCKRCLAVRRFHIANLSADLAGIEAWERGER